jgi:hypothetical protein
MAVDKNDYLTFYCGFGCTARVPIPWLKLPGLD